MHSLQLAHLLSILIIKHLVFSNVVTTTANLMEFDLSDHCQWVTNMDIVILVDISCPMTTIQCQTQQQRIADTIATLKRPQSNYRLPDVRAAYIEYDTDTVNIVVDITYKPWNTRQHGGVTMEMMESYSNLTATRCDNIEQSVLSDRRGKPALYDAIIAAMQQFNKGGSKNRNRDRKILIFSNCETENVQTICEKHEQDLRLDVDIVMVNIGDWIQEPEEYIMCLVDYDELKVFVDTDWDNDRFYDEILEDVTNGLCTPPTPTPTTDPTKEPTTSSAKSTTVNPTTAKPTKSKPKSTAVCMMNIDCQKSESCVNSDCIDPCTLNVCGTNASCVVINHRAICQCPPGFAGDPFTACVAQSRTTSDPTTSDPTTVQPTTLPTNNPTTIDQTTSNPTTHPTMSPTANPITDPTNMPTIDPTTKPTSSDPTTSDPTSIPTNHPTTKPSNFPTSTPTIDPTKHPTMIPSLNPTELPTFNPTTPDPTTSNPTSIPTSIPTLYPTNSPTNNPTTNPSTDPTKDPTIDPTMHPTPNPTDYPATDTPTTSTPTTINPTTANPTTSTTAQIIAPITTNSITKNPTTATPTATTRPTLAMQTRAPSVNRTGDNSGGIPNDIMTRNPTTTEAAIPNCGAKLIDIVVIVDTSYAMGYDQCHEQQRKIAEAVASFKPREHDKRIPNVRVSVIEMGSKDVFIRLDMRQLPYNRETGPHSDMEVLELYELINRAGGCYPDRENMLLQRKGNPNLYDALQCSLNQFDFNDTLREKKIVIWSNSKTESTDRICELYHTNDLFQDIDDIIMYNDNRDMSSYLMCLVDYQRENILTNPTRSDGVWATIILPTLKRYLCD